MKTTYLRLLALILSAALLGGNLAVLCGDDALPPDSLIAKGRSSHKGKSKKPKAPKIVDVSLQGTIEEVQPNALKIKATSSGKTSKKGSKSSSGGEWIVYPQPNTQLEIKATAEMDYLRPGQVVQFSGILSGDNIADKVAKLTILPKHGHTLSIGGASGKPKDPGVAGQRIELPKEATNSDLAALAGSVETAQPKQKAGAAPPTAKPRPVRGPKTLITARIESIKDKTMVVGVGSRKLTATLADLPAIQVETDDHHLIAAGAKIALHGKGVHGKVNLCQASDITVTLTTPLLGKKKANPSPSRFKLPSASESVDLPKLAAEQSESSDEEN